MQNLDTKLENIYFDSVVISVSHKLHLCWWQAGSHPSTTGRVTWYRDRGRTVTSHCYGRMPYILASVQRESMAIYVTYDKVWDQGYICRQWGIKVITYDKVSDKGSFWRHFFGKWSSWNLYIRMWDFGRVLWFTVPCSLLSPHFSQLTVPMISEKCERSECSDLSVSERSEPLTSQKLRGWTPRPFSFWEVGRS